eukprot:scaffold142728_cov32-Tisochrysis_lutea.AAC.2
MMTRFGYASELSLPLANFVHSRGLRSHVREWYGKSCRRLAWPEQPIGFHCSFVAMERAAAPAPLPSGYANCQLPPPPACTLSAYGISA